MRSLLFRETQPVDSERRWVKQNRNALRVGLGPDVLAAKGTMTSYLGDVAFHHEKSGSMGKLAKKVVTGEDVSLMRVSGQGQVWFAQNAGYVFTIDLENEGISLNFRNLLAFDATLTWDINRIKGAGIMAGNGLFNTTVGGTGTVGINSIGRPVVLDCSKAPVSVDPHSAVAWSANLAPTVNNSMNMSSMLRGGSGEAIQYVFHGPGFVVIQAYEWTAVQQAENKGKGAISGAINLFT
ncbi:AIM24 family protein [Nocardioides alcanivorans]|uniref:AIM24 family protein n=1 Tax=Nocardioides alcanivorans TaxID=2897352 RepID=UPI001F2FE60F|nr:AIM24 family protein [Nocardioides alcanivorans]